MEIFVRDRHADLGQFGRPAQQGAIGFDAFGHAPGRLRVHDLRGAGDPFAMLGVQTVAQRHPGHGHLTHVGAGVAPEQVVQHALTQRTRAVAQRFDTELIEDRGHDRQPAGQHRAAVAAQSFEFDFVCAAGAHQFDGHALQ